MKKDFSALILSADNEKVLKYDWIYQNLLRSFTFQNNSKLQIDYVLQILEPHLQKQSQVNCLTKREYHYES